MKRRLSFYLLAAVVLTIVAISQPNPLSLTLTSPQQFYHSSENIPITAQLLYNGTPIGNTPLTLTADAVTIVNRTDARGQTLFEIPAGALRNGRHTAIVTYQGFATQTASSIPLITYSSSRTYKPKQTPSLTIKREPFSTQGTAVLENSLGNVVDVPIDITTNATHITYSIPPEYYRPGRYTLRVPGSEELSFIWGVLAFNFDASSYLSGDNVLMQIAVLDDQGAIVCDADVTIEVTDPSGETILLSTNDQTVVVSDECTHLGPTQLPDYYALYTTTEEGEYHVRIRALTYNGPRELEETFTVEERAVVMSRNGPTRIYPLDNYHMQLEVSTAQNYNGVVREVVPSSFIITPQPGMIIVQNGDEQQLQWNVNIPAGGTEILTYEFNPPDISPSLHLLGPARAGTFSEPRQWMIASDEIAAGSNADTLLMAQECALEAGGGCGGGATICENFASACTGTFPSSCPADTLSCNDAAVESTSLSNNAFGGVRITSFNTSITDCRSVTSVSVCYEWYTSSTQTYSFCRVGVDNAGDLSWTTTDATCPTTLQNDVNCVTVTSLEGGWDCSDFFEPGAASSAYVEAKRTSGGQAHTLNIDALYFNVTYDADTTPPNVSVVSPTTTYVRGSFLINVSANESQGFVNAINVTLYNNTGNATAAIILTLGTGTSSSGYFNATFDSTQLRDGTYNISPSASDDFGNSIVGANRSITIDNTNPNATLLTPRGPLNTSGTIILNGSVNDTLSTTAGVSYYLRRPGFSSSELPATRTTGTAITGYWSATFPTTTLADGLYNITLRAVDVAGNVIFRNETNVTIDNTHPNATIIVPLNNTNTSQSILVNASINDSTTRILNVSYRAINPGFTGSWIGAIRGSGSDLTGYWNLTLTGIPEGRYNISVNATDFTHNQFIANISHFTFDTTPPNVSLLAPTAFLNTSQQFLINASANDSLTGILNVSYRISSTSFASAWLIAARSGTLTTTFWTITPNIAPFDDGHYNITINATDFAGNQNITNLTTVTIDRLAPNATIIAPQNGSVVAQTITLNSSINDSTSLVQHARYRLSGDLGTSPWFTAELLTGNIGTGYWTVNFNTFQLPNGLYNVTINTSDFAGNEQLVNVSEVEVDNILDFVAPNASVVYPYNHNVSGVITINASVNDTDGSIFQANATIYNNTGNVSHVPLFLTTGTTVTGFWTANFDTTQLPDGSYNVSVNATDQNQNTNRSLNASFVVDNTAPNASMVTPLNGSVLADITFLINVSVNDSLTGVNSVRVRLHQPGQAGMWLTASHRGTMHSSYWNVSVNSQDYENGLYNITVDAQDYAGSRLLANLSEVEIDNFIPDTTAPNITFVSPTYTNISGQFILNVSINDTGGDLPGNVVMANATIYNNTGNVTFVNLILGAGNDVNGYWNATVLSQTLPDGTYNLSVSALDNSGNHNVSENLTIVIDNTFANTSIVSPSNHTNTSTAFLINASINDSTTGIFNVTFRLSSNQETTEWHYMQLQGNIHSSYRSNTIPLSMSDGTYNITINATDYANNQLLANLSTITIDTVAPNGSVITPFNLSNISGNVLFNLSVNDTTSGIVVAGLQLQRPHAAPNEYFTTLSSGTLQSGQWTITIDTTILTDGLYNVTLNLTDFSGNKLLQNHTQLTIDNTPPTAISRSPLNGSLQGSEVNINITATDLASQVASLEVRLIAPSTGTTEWFPAALNSGTITSGAWNKTIDTNTILDGDYNISVRITDFAGNQFIANMSNIQVADQSTLSVSSADYCAGGSCATPVDTTAQVVTDNDGQTRTVNGRNGDLVRVDVWSFFVPINEDDAILGVTASCNFASSDNNFHVHYDWCDNSIAGDCSTDDSSNWNTNFCQSIAQPSDTSCNLFANGVDTVDEVNNLWIRCVSEDDDGSGADQGTLDFVQIDVFYQALTDLEPPNVSIRLPLNASNISQLLTLNATANDSRQIAYVNATLYNSTGNVSTRDLSLYSGTAFEGLWNATFDTTAITDGEYILRASAADLKGNDNHSQNVTLFIDNTPPNQTIVVPLNNTNTSQNILINVSINDSITGVAAARVRVISETQTQYYPLNRTAGTIHAGYWNYTFDTSSLADGRYNVSVQSSDYAGTGATSNVSYFTLDRAPPNTSLILPVQLNTSTSFSVNASANDSLTGIFNVSFRLENGLASSAWMYSEAYAGDIYNGAWNSSISITGLTDGLYNITLNATDFAGNQNVSNTTTIVLDTTPANATIVSPSNYTNLTGTFLINASVNDTLSGVERVSYRLASSAERSTWNEATRESGSIKSGYWTVLFDPASLADDQYNLTLNATDFAGNQNLINISTIFIDRTAPNITIIVPLNGTNTSIDVFVNASANDTSTGVKSVQLRLISAQETAYVIANRSSGNARAGYWNATLPVAGLTDGVYNISAYAIDYAESETNVNSSFIIIDTTPPSASAVTPENGNFSHDFSVNLSVNDSLSSVYNTTIRLASSEFTSAWFFAELNSGSTFTGYWSAFVTIGSIPDGTYNITVNATDTLGLQNLSNVSVVRIDTTAANITALSPLNDSNHTALFLINASVNDSVSGVRNVSYRIINSDTTSVWLSANSQGTILTSYWNSSFDPSALNDGRYNITANATDYADNQLLVNITTLTIDNTAPNVSIVAPLNGSNSTGSALVNLSANDSVSAVYNVSFRLASPDIATEWQRTTLNSGSSTEGYWDALFDTTLLSDGAYNITVNASDFSGNALVANLSQITIDNNAPNASVVSPTTANVSSDFTLNTSINDSTTEVLNVSARLANSEVTDAWQYLTLTSGSALSGYWSRSLSITGVQDGVYNITINATDFAGNTNLSNISTVTIDRVAPNASVIQPVNDTNLSGIFLLNISTNDSLTGVQTVNVRLTNGIDSNNWQPAALDTSSFLTGYWSLLFDSTTLSDGRYNVTINTTDFTGNTYAANLTTITIDNTQPNATIIVPLNLSYAVGNLLINSSVNDSSGIASVAYRIYNSSTNVSPWISSSQNSGTYNAGYWNITFGADELRDDPYNITINATDGAANSILVNISTFIRDTTGPAIALTAPVNDYNTSNATINFTWIPTDRFSPSATCSFSIDETVNITSIGAGSGVETNATLNNAFAGMHSWNVTCVDEQGNSRNSELRNYTLIEAPANITAVIAPDNQSITLHWSNVSYADYFAIYISDNLEQFPLLPNVTGIRDLNYTDANSSNATLRYYKIATFRGGANTSTPDIFGKQQITLEPEYNLMSFSLAQNLTLLRNSTYNGYDLAVTPANCVSEIWRYNASFGFEETLRNGNGWLPAAGSENFTALSATEGYWLYNQFSQPCNLSIAGKVPTINVTVDLDQNFNLVSWHSQRSPELPQNCDPSYPFDVDPLNSLHNLFYYNATEGEFRMSTHFTSSTCPDNDWGWFPDSRSEDFTSLTPGKGYYIDANQSAVWTVDTYR